MTTRVILYLPAILIVCVLLILVGLLLELFRPGIFRECWQLLTTPDPERYGKWGTLNRTDDAVQQKVISSGLEEHIGQDPL